PALDIVVATRLLQTASQQVLLGIAQATLQPPFASSATTRVEELREPLANAARLHCELLAIGWKSSVAHHALDRLTAAVMIADGRGHLVDMNCAAQSVLRRADGLVLQGCKITARHPSDGNRLAALIAAATASEDTLPAVKWV